MRQQTIEWRSGTRIGRSPLWPAVLAWTLWVVAIFCLLAIVWLDHLLRKAGRPDLALLTAGAVLPLLGLTSAATVGAIVATRRPRHPVGWLLLATSVVMGANGIGKAYADYGLVARPGALPAASPVALYYPAAVITLLVCIGFVLLLTPTGSLPSPHWRWWARVTAAAPVVTVLAITLAPTPHGQPYRAAENPVDLPGLGGAQQVTYQVAYAVSMLAVVVAAGSLVVRFRRARGTERQQLRWVALAAALMAPAAVVMLAGMAMGSAAILGWASGACVAPLPLGIGAAILRYRLYDLDRIISRTLSYSILTLLLGGGYAAVVVGLGQLLGRSSGLAVAAATVAVAAVFQPARRRIQNVVDRRFNRRRYDATRTVEAFASRLRQQIDLDALTAELLTVVDQTVQPTRALLWLRPTVDEQPPAQPSSPPGNDVLQPVVVVAA